MPPATSPAFEDGDGADSVHRIQAACQGRPWRILASGDATFAEARCAGAHAAISSTACALPELMTALDRAPQDPGLNARLREFLSWVDQFPQPVIVKTATTLRRLKTGPLSVPLSPEKQKKLEQFQAWFEPWLARKP